MKDRAKERESREKVEFWDTILKFYIPLLVLAIFAVLFMDSIANFWPLLLIFVILGLIGAILGLIFNLGMIYHAYKSKEYVWLTFMIVLFFVGLLVLITIFFYLIDMRDNFKEGKGTYDK